LKVMKFGGSSLTTGQSMLRIGEIIAAEKEDKVVVVSAVSGITESLIQFISQTKSENEVIGFIQRLRETHLRLISDSVFDRHQRDDANARINEKLVKLERMLYGISYLEEVTPRTKDFVQCYGERLSAIVVSAMLRDRGVDAVPIDADELGIITDGVYGAAIADLEQTQENIRDRIMIMFGSHQVPVVTGFFGRAPDGSVTVFGRNGSDYSAAAIANAISAGSLEIWKDVDGFMSVDPKIVPKAIPIPQLSYEEAAELAYFGAKVLHPMTVVPARAKDIVIVIKNVYRPDLPGTSVSKSTPEDEAVIKSISCMKNLGIVKIFAEDTGYRSGFLSQLSRRLNEAEVNILSVATSLTCVAMLVDRKDLKAAKHALESEKQSGIVRIETSEDIALVCLVGEGIGYTRGVASRAFNAVAAEGINIGLISAGASLVAYHFTVNKDDLEVATKAIHKEFFGC
jgi:bifunctional aspartokinase / homoserine dehydrogenase 1